MEVALDSNYTDDERVIEHLDRHIKQGRPNKYIGRVYAKSFCIQYYHGH